MFIDAPSYQPAKKATIYLVAFYKACQPTYPYKKEMKDYKMPITRPTEKVQNNGHDNSHGDYVFRVGDYICDTSAGAKPKTTYLVESLLGQGSFGQVLRCLDINTHASYAIKVIKNLPAYNQQAKLERTILRMVLFLSSFEFTLFSRSVKRILRINVIVSV